MGIVFIFPKMWTQNQKGLFTPFDVQRLMSVKQKVIEILRGQNLVYRPTDGHNFRQVPPSPFFVGGIEMINFSAF